MSQNASIITVAIEKGGNAKTTTAINLAALAGAARKKVLVVDIDAQANSTYTLTAKPKSEWRGHGVFDMLRVFDREDIDPAEFISPTSVPGVDLLPSNEQTVQLLKQLEIFKEIHGRPTYVYLAAALGRLTSRYDLIVIDTPPSQDDLALSGLFAADEVILPVKADQYSVHGLLNTYALIDKLRREENAGIHILGVLLTMVERTALTGAIRAQIAGSEFGEYLFKSEIRKGQAVNDSTAMCQPVVLYAKNSNPAKDYAALYKEVCARLRAAHG